MCCKHMHAYMHTRIPHMALSVCCVLCAVCCALCVCSVFCAQCSVLCALCLAILAHTDRVQVLQIAVLQLSRTLKCCLYQCSRPSVDACIPHMSATIPKALEHCYLRYLQAAVRGSTAICGYLHTIACKYLQIAVLQSNEARNACI